jgi:hypothetical protein
MVPAVLRGSEASRTCSARPTTTTPSVASGTPQSVRRRVSCLDSTSSSSPRRGVVACRSEQGGRFLPGGTQQAPRWSASSGTSPLVWRTAPGRSRTEPPGAPSRQASKRVGSKPLRTAHPPAQGRSGSRPARRVEGVGEGGAASRPQALHRSTTATATSARPVTARSFRSPTRETSRNRQLVAGQPAAGTSTGMRSTWPSQSVWVIIAAPPGHTAATT